MRSRWLGLVGMVCLSLALSPAQAQQITIKLATVAPSGSSWDEALKDMGQRWAELSHGQVKLIIYAGGVAGDELDVMRRIRFGQLQAALITNHGLGSINQATRALTLPRMLRSYEEFDYVMERLAPRMDELLEEGGFVALGWAEGGLVRFFVPRPVTSLVEVQKLKMFTWAGDADTTQLWQKAGFNAVPLPATEVMTGIQTGLIEAIPTTPTIALASQWFPHAPYMLDLDIAPLAGALVVSRRAWQRVPPEVRPLLEAEARKTVQRMRDENRRLEADAIEAMKKRGLKVILPTREETARWDAKADEVNRSVRGSYVPEWVYDEILRLVRAYRAGQTSGPGR